MTDQSTPASGSQAAESGSQVTPSREALEALAELTGQDEATGVANGSVEEQVQPDPGTMSADQEILVPWGETTRKMKVGDLLEAAQMKSDLERDRQAVDANMAKLGQIAALVERMNDQGTPEEHRQAMQALLNGDVNTAARLIGAQSSKASDDDEDLSVEEILEGPRPKHHQAKDPRLDDVIQAVQMLVEDKREEIQTKEAQKLSDKVEDTLKGFSLFANPRTGQVNNPALLRRAKEDILYRYGAQPGADLEKIITQIVADTQALLANGHVPQSQSQSPAVSRSDLGLPPMPQSQDLADRVASATFRKPGSTKQAAVDLFRVIAAQQRQT